MDAECPRASASTIGYTIFIRTRTICECSSLSTLKRLSKPVAIVPKNGTVVNRLATVVVVVVVAAVAAVAVVAVVAGVVVVVAIEAANECTDTSNTPSDTRLLLFSCQKRTISVMNATRW